MICGISSVYKEMLLTDFYCIMEQVEMSHHNTEIKIVRGFMSQDI